MDADKKRLWVSGQFIEVTDEVYDAYMKGDRKMRYFESDLKAERFLLDKEGQIRQIIPSREDSLDRLMDDNAEQFADQQESVEDVVFRRFSIERLYDALELLTEKERSLINALFFDDMTEREVARVLGISQPAVHKQKNKILNIIKELGSMCMADVTLDDIQVALVPVSKKSASVYKSVIILYKSIFKAAQESHIIDQNPTIYLTAKGGGVPQQDKPALTDEQVARLLDAIRELPPYVFVMIGLYAGLRREEILALKWDSVYLDTDAPYLTVRRAWHTEHNRPVILTELKTKAAERNVPLPDCLVECLREAKANSTSEYVVANRDGDPLSYTQFKRLWQYIVTRTAKERCYYRYENGVRVKHIVTPKLGEKAAHNGKVVYSLDFEVTPHQLRHTYITNLIHASVDPKTVQYLAGHESSKITMDIYAKAKYNRPDELVGALTGAFERWDAS